LAHGGTFAERLAKVDAHAFSNPKLPVSSYIRDFFPELVIFEVSEHPRLPEKAPTLWTEGRKNGEIPPDFIKRVYGPYLKGMTRADIMHLDPQFNSYLRVWLRTNSMPDDLDLPTVKEKNDRTLSAIENSIGAQEEGRWATLVSNRRWTASRR
jgi:hypothetical protein